MGEKASEIKRADYGVGVKYINPTYYFKSTFSELLKGKNKVLILKKIMRELQGRKVNNNIDSSDWLFIVAKWIKETAEAIQRIFSSRHVLRRP
jgi:hypothetical protein